MRNDLPESCFSVLESTGELVLLKSGERGYYATEWNTDDPEKNRTLSAELNRKAGVNAAQRMAMEYGSLFGWSIPAANPQFYLNEVEQADQRPAKGHIRDMILSILYPIQCDLNVFRVAGEEQFYLPLEALPQSWLESNKDFVLLPDLVRGRPYLPVNAAWSDNGSCTISLKHDAVSYDKEVNAGYRITAKVRVGNIEVVLGEQPKAPAGFVTWERNLLNDKDGTPNYFWGHYFVDRERAAKEFGDRAAGEYAAYKRMFQRTQDRKVPEKER